MTTLNEAMDERRVELDRSWVQVAQAAKLSISGLSGIRAGDRNPSKRTKRRLEYALQWASGSIDAVLDGREPVPVSAEVDAALPDQAHLRDQIGRLMAEAEEHLLARRVDAAGAAIRYARQLTEQLQEARSRPAAEPDDDQVTDRKRYTA